MSYLRRSFISGLMTSGIAPFSYTRFKLALVSYLSGNTSMIWKDVSFNSGDATIFGDFVLVPEGPGGINVYRANATATTESTILFPSISAAPSDYTIYMGVTVIAETNCYILLMRDSPAIGATGNFTYFGLNTSELGAFFERRNGYVSGSRVNITAGNTGLLTFRLNSAGASVRLNGVTIQSNLPYTQAWFDGGYFGNQQNNRLLNGKLSFLCVALGNDSDAQVAQTEAKFATDLGITL